MFSAVVLANIIRFYGHAMQGVMGPFLEKNIQAFLEIQSRFQEQNQALFTAKSFAPETWAQFMSGQAPMLQSMMGSYLEQSKNLFMQMQEQMQNQTKTMFGNYPFGGVDSRNK